MTVNSGSEDARMAQDLRMGHTELARRLHRAADEPVAAHEGLVRMIRAWERGGGRRGTVRTPVPPTSRAAAPC